MLIFDRSSIRCNRFHALIAMESIIASYNTCEIQ